MSKSKLLIVPVVVVFLLASAAAPARAIEGADLGRAVWQWLGLVVGQMAPDATPPAKRSCGVDPDGAPVCSPITATPDRSCGIDPNGVWVCKPGQ
jgi:hypothetical protein